MAEQLCKICSVNDSKYVCPRCNLLYCSVQCYQSRLHLRCSEEFYKENVFEHLTLNEKNLDDVNKIKDILHRVYEKEEDEEANITDSDSLDSDDEQDITERLSAVCLDDADAIWENLLASEKQAFVDFLDKGCPETLVPLWDPWWMYRSESKIEILKDSTAEGRCYIDKCPRLRTVPQFTDLTKLTPSPCVKWNIINVVGSYAYTMRYFNGEPTDFVIEAMDLFLSISGNLRDNYNYDSYDTAIGDISHEILQRSWLDGSETALAVMKDDVQRILHGPENSNASFYLQAALSDVIHLLVQSKCSPKTEGNNLNNQKENRKDSFSKQFRSVKEVQQVSKAKIKSSLRKVEYLLSWVRACPNS